MSRALACVLATTVAGLLLSAVALDPALVSAQTPPAVFYGTVDPAETVEVSVRGVVCVTTSANATGFWSLQVNSADPCKPMEGDTVTFKRGGRPMAATEVWKPAGAPADPQTGVPGTLAPVQPAPASPLAGLAAGTLPAAGGQGLLVTERETTVVKLTESLAAARCFGGTIAVAGRNGWDVFIVSAPVRVNARFPRELKARTPFFLRCGFQTVGDAAPPAAPPDQPLPAPVAPAPVPAAPTPAARPPILTGITAFFDEVWRATTYQVQYLNPDGAIFRLRWTGPNCGTWGKPAGFGDALMPGGETETILGLRGSASFMWVHPHPPCGSDPSHSEVTIVVQTESPLRGAPLEHNSYCRYPGAASGESNECGLDGSPAR